MWHRGSMSNTSPHLHEDEEGTSYHKLFIIQMSLRNFIASSDAGHHVIPVLII